MKLFQAIEMFLGLRRNFILLLMPLLPIFSRTFKMILTPKLIILRDLTNLHAIVVSLAFKSGNLIKVLVSGFEIPFASPPKTGLPSPRFKAW